MGEQLPAQRGGAKAMLLTVLGEFVLRAGGAAWTSSLVAAADVLGIGEKNSRQAIARIGEQGLIESSRTGRRVRWALTPDGRRLLESGTERIYGFGRNPVDWKGSWLVAHCPVAESRRGVRNQLRTELGFLGFGELSASLLISPHLEREPALRTVLHDLGLLGDSLVLRSTTAADDDDVAMASNAWDLEALGSSYEAFCRTQSVRRTTSAESSFRSLVELVHDWRRFPFIDPELPTELLPDGWAGAAAVEVFHDRHDAWSADAFEWFDALEEAERQAS